MKLVTSQLVKGSEKFEGLVYVPKYYSQGVTQY